MLGGLALALIAGVVSFSSPCCLPLMPGYVSYVSGVAGPASEPAASRRRTLVAAALFVIGFSIVFTALGAGASAVGSSLLRHRTGLTQLGGILVVVLGLATIGFLRAPIFYRERRLQLHRLMPGPAGAVPLGMAFAIGWTPCIGPVLAGILTLAASGANVAYGASLLLVYSLGLGIPFVLLAFGLSRGGRATSWLRRRARAVEIVGGSMLVVMGTLMITGAWLRLFTPLLRWFSRGGWPPV